MTDRVDIMLREWQIRRPDLDMSALAVVSRLLRAAYHMQARLDGLANAYGLSHQGDVEVLTHLYRVHPERGLTPTELAEALLLTAGGMTVRLRRLREAGLISRRPNPRDGRGVLVRLTAAGIELAEHALPTLLEAQADSIEGLAPVERDHLADLLRTLLEGLGDVPAFRPPISVPSQPAPTGTEMRDER